MNFREKVLNELIRLNPFLQGLTREDAEIWAKHALGQALLGKRCVALAVVHMDRKMGSYTS